MGALGEVHRSIDHIAEHGAGRGQPACSPAVEHQRADCLTLDEDGVEALPHTRQRVGERNHGGVHPHCDVAGDRVGLGDAEQLHHIAETLRHGDVVGADATDALVVHIAGHDLGPEGDGGHDRRLGTRVETLDVGCGIAFGEAQLLGLGERRRVVGAFLGHLGEDEVGGAVDDAHHPLDRLTAQALTQRPDHGDTPGYRRLEQEVDTHFVGRGEQFGADIGEQFLVGGDDRLAVA